MSIPRQDENYITVTKPLAVQSPMQRTLKRFMTSAECPAGWKYELCWSNQNRQTGRPILKDVPLGAVFSIEDPQNPHCMLPMERRVYEESKIANRGTFWADDRTRNLNFYVAESSEDLRVPQGWVRGATAYQVADHEYHGVFWKEGPGGTNAQSPEVLYPGGCCPVVDLSATLERGVSNGIQDSFALFPQSWSIARQISAHSRGD